MKVIVYTSELSPHAGAMGEVVLDIATKSEANNPTMQITGAMVFLRSRFVQALEGPKENIDCLFEKIRQDPRHRNVKVLFDEPTSHRHFPDWAMQCFQLDDENVFDEAAVVSVRDLYSKQFQYDGKTFLKLLQSMLKNKETFQEIRTMTP